EKSQCVKLQDCHPVVTFLNDAPKPFPDEVISAFHKFTCEFREEILDTLVCCPSQPVTIDKDGNILGPPPPPPNVANHPSLKYLPEDCGLIGISNKIIGGENAGIVEFPWMALLLYRTGETIVPNCGGTIINNKYILTAAHCLSNLPTPFVGVRVGDYQLSTEKDCVQEEHKRDKCIPPVQHLIPERIIIHPEYSTQSQVNDIALIRVTKMNYAENVRAVCLPTPEEIINDDFKTGYVSGWGYLGSNGSKADILQRVSLEKRNMSLCAEVYKDNPRLLVTANSYKRLCIGGKQRKDSCKGDSGGPLQVAANYNDEDKYFQRGIVSLGHRDCGTDNFPAIYTFVDRYVDWILDNINP
ncbi:hypothetical protein NQ315_009583, partial [Exocentrus adspersus]